MTRLILTLALLIAASCGHAFAQKTAAEIAAHCETVKNSDASGEGNFFPGTNSALWRCVNGTVYTTDEDGRQKAEWHKMASGGLPQAEITRIGNGSFAIDLPAKRYGYSWNEPNQQDADAAALKGCGSPGCKIVFKTEPASCSAVAMSTDSAAWGGAIRDTKQVAELAAMESCKKRSAVECKVRASQCNGPPLEAATTQVATHEGDFGSECPIIDALSNRGPSGRDAISALISGGTDLNCRFRGQTALHRASDLAVVEMLIKAGADINAQDSSGNTPLYVQAVMYGNTSISRLLIEAGAKNLRNKEGNLALDQAIQSRRDSALIALLQSLPIPPPQFSDTVKSSFVSTDPIIMMLAADIQTPIYFVLSTQYPILTGTSGAFTGIYSSYIMSRSTPIADRGGCPRALEYKFMPLTDWLATQVVIRLLGTGLTQNNIQSYVTTPALQKLHLAVCSARVAGFAIFDLGRFEVTEGSMINEFSGPHQATGAMTKFRSYKVAVEFRPSPGVASLIGSSKYGHAIWTLAFAMNPITTNWEFANFGEINWWKD